VRTLHEQQVLEWTYHSNAIEGNTTDATKKPKVFGRHHDWWQVVREHFEVTHHKDSD